MYEGDAEDDESGERDEDGGIGTSKFPSTFTQHGTIYRGARSKSELFPVFLNIIPPFFCDQIALY